ncbi:MAG: capsule assembly Wzi family protein, partial [Candidatus Deferrimicrobiaceae bacterium]
MLALPPSLRIACTLAVLLFLLFASPVPAADLFLTDEPEVYAVIDKLNAEGYLPGFIANTRPYSLRAVRAALAILRDPAPKGFNRELFRWLEEYVAPRQMGRLTGAVTHSDSRFTPGNNEGIPVPDGWAGYASIAAREETTPLVNGQVRFTSFYGEGGDDGNRLLDASLEVGYPWFAAQAGKISSWYGPGRRGALIFTNNAAPYTGVRLHNPVPIAAPRPIAFLGPFQYDLFVAQMDTDRPYPHSLLVGTRFAARPGRLLEVGFSRTVQYDGKSRSKGISEFSNAYFGNSEASGESSSLTGFDISLTLPFAAQPVQGYWERAVDDNSQLGQMFIPWSDVAANIFGLYLPRILGYSRLDFRFEYA